MIYYTRGKKTNPFEKNKMKTKKTTINKIRSYRIQHNKRNVGLFLFNNHGRMEEWKGEFGLVNFVKGDCWEYDTDGHKDNVIEMRRGRIVKILDKDVMRKPIKQNKRKYKWIKLPVDYNLCLFVTYTDKTEEISYKGEFKTVRFISGECTQYRADGSKDNIIYFKNGKKTGICNVLRKGRRHVMDLFNDIEMKGGCEKRNAKLHNKKSKRG